MRDLNSKALEGRKNRAVRPTASAFLEIVADAMVDYLFSRMLLQEGQYRDDATGEARLLSMSIRLREHITRMINQFEEYIEKIPGDKKAQDKRKDKKDLAIGNPIQQVWEEKMREAEKGD